MLHQRIGMIVYARILNNFNFRSTVFGIASSFNKQVHGHEFQDMEADACIFPRNKFLNTLLKSRNLVLIVTGFEEERILRVLLMLLIQGYSKYFSPLFLMLKIAFPSTILFNN